MNAKKVKLCRLCGGKRVFGKTLCYACILKKERAKRELKLAKLKERKHKKKEKKLNSYRYLNKVAWELFSRYIRMKGADENGMTECYTCEKKFHWKKLFAGHFHHGKLDFDERNVHKQCNRCNSSLFLRGNLNIYGTKLAQEIGAEGMKQLLLDANTKIYTWQELKIIINRLQI